MWVSLFVHFQCPWKLIWHRRRSFVTGKHERNVETFLFFLFAIGWSGYREPLCAGEVRRRLCHGDGGSFSSSRSS